MLFQMLYGFLATAGFGILFNIPKKHIMDAGFSGAVSWAGYLAINKLYGSPVAATFIASILIGIMGELYARKAKNPATIFIIPAIIPIVPGITSYRTVKALIDGDSREALGLALLTAGLALAIASGLILVISIFRLVRERGKR